jgi:hypothetical protein
MAMFGLGLEPDPRCLSGPAQPQHRAPHLQETGRRQKEVLQGRIQIIFYIFQMR